MHSKVFFLQFFKTKVFTVKLPYSYRTVTVQLRPVTPVSTVFLVKLHLNATSLVTNRWFWLLRPPWVNLLSGKHQERTILLAICSGCYGGCRPAVRSSTSYRLPRPPPVLSSGLPCAPVDHGSQCRDEGRPSLTESTSSCLYGDNF